ncbi:hypothetical protein [Robiginitalea sp.]|uniref:hypothetical protein n=1 Tax=Robiginitalea sp. TaxID=1902411 RepID=UPI003C5CDF82
MMPDFVHSFSPGYPTMFYLSMGQRFPFLLYLFSCLTLFPGALLMGQSEHSADYLTYHSSVNQAENQLSEGNFQEALITYTAIFDTYPFVFGREAKIAVQLALYLKEDEKALALLQKVIHQGIDLREVKRLPGMKRLRKTPAWDHLEKSYDNLDAASLHPVDIPVLEAVQDMYKKDQKKAIGALFRMGDKAQIAYGEKVFAPHSEEQLSKLTGIITSGGYPGEKRIRNDYWASTILSHHNSISTAYNQQDSLYPKLKPLLLEALKAGDISPYELAMVEDWRIATISGWAEPGYGYLNAPREQTLNVTDSLREAIGLRSVSLRNRLVALEVETGMDFFLPDWVRGKIQIITEEE